MNDEHPETTCDRCEGPNLPSWWVDSDRFNAAMAAIGSHRGAIVCPQCFVEGHEQATGMTTSWELRPSTPFRPIDVRVAGVTHRCPPDGSGTMPCCGRTPFEVPRRDRMTVHDDLVTCIR